MRMLNLLRRDLMKNEDAQLVNQFLTGDENAFTTLVKKYQKSVHALVWRKVGDFHTAEELAQDTFLKAYQKLATLKNPTQFAGWLYVIADRICIDWHRKQKPSMESLETTSGAEIEESPTVTTKTNNVRKLPSNIVTDAFEVY